MARFAQMPLTLKQNLRISNLSRINSRKLIMYVQVNELSLFIDEFYFLNIRLNDIVERIVEQRSYEDSAPCLLLIKLLNNASLTAFVMRKTRQLVRPVSFALRLCLLIDLLLALAVYLGEKQ